MAVIAAALVLGACGAPRGGAVQTIPAEEVPYALLDPAAPPEVDRAELAPAAAGAQVYLIDREDRLVPVSVPTTSSGLEPVAREVLGALVAGPSDEQRAAGLTTSLAPDLDLDLVEVAGGVATVDVSNGEREPAADRIPLVVGEIVLTLTSVPGVDSVLLLGDGEPIEAPLPGGARTTDPVTAADYATLLAGG